MSATLIKFQGANDRYFGGSWARKRRVWCGGPNVVVQMRDLATQFIESDSLSDDDPVGARVFRTVALSRDIALAGLHGELDAHRGAVVEGQQHVILVEDLDSLLWHTQKKEICWLAKLQNDKQ